MSDNCSGQVIERPERLAEGRVCRGRAKWRGLPGRRKQAAERRRARNSNDEEYQKMEVGALSDALLLRS